MIRNRFVIVENDLATSSATNYYINNQCLQISSGRTCQVDSILSEPDQQPIERTFQTIQIIR